MGPVREDLEDHFLAVNDGQLCHFLPVALLRGREGGVEDDDVCSRLLGKGGDLRAMTAGRPIDIEVDGGVAPDVAAQLAAAGVNPQAISCRMTISRKT